MSVQFNIYSPSARQFLNNADTEPSFNGYGAGLVGEALGLTEVWSGGACSLPEFRARLLRWPDGHPNPDVQFRLAQLVEMVLSVKNAPADAKVTWG